MQTRLQVQTLLKPRGCTAIMGQREVFGLASWLTAQVLVGESSTQVVCVDGANRFDPLMLSRLSRASGTLPQDWLGRVFVTRAYSGNQLIGALIDKAIPYCQQSPPTMCLALGWLETLYDEDVDEDQARAWLEVVLHTIQRLKQCTHLVLFESAFLDVSGPRTGFIHRVLGEVDEVLNWTPDGRLYG